MLSMKRPISLITGIGASPIVLTSGYHGLADGTTVYIFQANDPAARGEHVVLLESLTRDTFAIAGTGTQEYDPFCAATWSQSPDSDITFTQSVNSWATITSANHGLAVGDLIAISGDPFEQCNGDLIVGAVVDGDKFRLDVMVDAEQRHVTMEDSQDGQPGGTWRRR